MPKDREIGEVRRAYKLLTVRKNGTYGPLFINRPQVIPLSVWLEAECHPTKGFKVRPGWHCSWAPRAPHLGTKNRAWFAVDVMGWSEFKRPDHQGGMWLIAKRMRLVRRLDEAEVLELAEQLSNHRRAV